MVSDDGHGQVLRPWGSERQSSCPSSGCSKSEGRPGMRDEGVTSQRTENLEEVGRAGTGGHSQVPPARLQTTASGVQVYFGGL